MKLLLLFILVILISSPLYAIGESDSVNVELCDKKLSKLKSALSIRDPYVFKPKQIIVPAALIAAGATSFYISEVKHFDRSTQNEISLGHSRLHFDDYLQYAPVALTWGLDLAGVESRHKFKEQTTVLAISALAMCAMVNGTKYTIRRKRPDLSAHNSFPSGHTAMAFMGAEFLRMEFWDVSPWIGVAGYAMAATTAYMRIYNNRHWLTDTLAGAGVGILSVKIAYWLAPDVNRWLWGSDLRGERNYAASLSPFSNGEQYGLNFSMNF